MFFLTQGKLKEPAPFAGIHYIGMSAAGHYSTCPCARCRYGYV
ncbi:hypothetical protein [Ferdinandcohnia sp. SAFN-114]